EVGAVALEALVLRNADDDVEIARRCAALARLARASDAERRPVLDARGNADLHLAVLLHTAGAAAVRARVLDDLAETAAARAGLRHREEALRDADLSAAIAIRAA